MPHRTPSIARRPSALLFAIFATATSLFAHDGTWSIKVSMPPPPAGATGGGANSSVARS